MTTATLTPKQATLQALEARKKKRVPELEPTIMQDPIAACFYAKSVVKGRWEEGEAAIAKGLSKRFNDFNILDEDTRVRTGNYPIGPRPKGSDHVKEGNEIRLLVVYMRMVKCRVPAFEEALKAERWKGNAHTYCDMVFRYTGELIDLDSPEVCSWMIKDLITGRKHKKMPYPHRAKVCAELHKRMILHSFGKGDNNEVRNYFREHKRAEGKFLIMLNQYEEGTTVGEVLRKITGETV